MKLLCGIAIVISGCTINGKAYGPGAQSPSSPSGPATSPTSGAAATPAAPASDDRSDLYTSDGRVREDARYYKEPPYLSEPADPWAAVAGDQPLRWSAEAAGHWTLRGNEIECTAKHDHCLVKDAWFTVSMSDLERSTKMIGAGVHVFGPEGPVNPWNSRGSGGSTDRYIAYRTVPATKHNLVPGAIVIGLSRDSGLPRSGIGAVEAFWWYGELEEADFDVGVYKLKGYNDTLALPGARVAVLSWKPGEKVQILGGKRRDQLGVKASDVLLPDK